MSEVNGLCLLYVGVWRERKVNAREEVYGKRSAQTLWMKFRRCLVTTLPAAVHVVFLGVFSPIIV